MFWGYTIIDKKEEFFYCGIQKKAADLRLLPYHVIEKLQT